MERQRIGRQAVVIGAGIGGLGAARAAADVFERVIVLDRDRFPIDPAPRDGTPQARHVHALLAGGQDALEALFPGLTEDITAAGAVPQRVGLDLRVERPGFDPFPRRDLGWQSLCLSRPLLEHLVRRRVSTLPGVELRQGWRVTGLLTDAAGTSVAGVRAEADDGHDAILPADLVIDASGRGEPTLALLASTGAPPPPTETIGVDIGYATAVFDIPAERADDWLGVMTLPGPGNARGAVMLPIEGGRWMLTLAGRHDDPPPGEWDALLAYARGLRTRTVADAVEGARKHGGVVRYRFPDSLRRRFERVAAFPRGLLPIGDAICRFNPFYGQGMSVAAQQARALARLLAESTGRADPLSDLAVRFFAEAQALIDTPWFGAAIPDFTHPQTRGERPADLDARLRYGGVVAALAAEDPAVHDLMLRVTHLRAPYTALREPALAARVAARMH